MPASSSRALTPQDDGDARGLARMKLTRTGTFTGTVNGFTDSRSAISSRYTPPAQDQRAISSVANTTNNAVLDLVRQAWGSSR